MLILFSVLVIGLMFWIALRTASKVQRSIDAANKKTAESKKKQSRYHWVFGSFHWIWTAIIPAARYVYREWKTAPPNSAEKFLWTMLLAATGAVVIWILMKILDKAINRGSKPAVQPDEALTR